MKKSVYLQKYNCIDLLNNSNTPLTIQINSAVCAIEFRHYAKTVDFEPNAFEVAFEDAAAVEVSLQDFIAWYLTYSEEALEIEAQYEEQLHELRELQNECADELFMMFVTSYVVFEEDEFIKRFESEEEAGKYIESSEYGAYYTKHCVEVDSISFSLGDDNDVWVVIEAEVDGDASEVTFNVQTIDGICMSQMGCWITTGAGDGEFTLIERVIFEATNVCEIAENWYLETIKTNFVYHDCGFNASINGQSVCIKEMNEEFLWRWSMMILMSMIMAFLKSWVGRLIA